jgi:hypothetical protein
VVKRPATQRRRSTVVTGEAAERHRRNWERITGNLRWAGGRGREREADRSLGSGTRASGTGAVSLCVTGALGIRIVL